jgi:hypothetical protein
MKHQQSPIRSPVIHSRLHRSVPHQQSPIRSPVVHSRLHRSVPHQQSLMRYWPGFDINGCPIARGKWNASSGKWKRHPSCPIGQVKMILWHVQPLMSNPGQYLINNLPSGVLLYIQGCTCQYLINNLLSGVLLYIQGYTGQYLINNLLSGILLY